MLHSEPIVRRQPSRYFRLAEHSHYCRRHLLMLHFEPVVPPQLSRYFRLIEHSHYCRRHLLTLHFEPVAPPLRPQRFPAPSQFLLTSLRNSVQPPRLVRWTLNQQPYSLVLYRHLQKHWLQRRRLRQNRLHRQQDPRQNHLLPQQPPLLKH